MSHLRHAAAELRYRRPGLRIGGPHATMRGHWLVASVSTLLVFGCFFAIGRLYNGGGGAAPAAAPSAQVTPGSGAVPTGLSGGSPTAGAVPVAIAIKPRVAAATAPAKAETEPSAPATTGSFDAEAARTTTPASETQVTSVPARETSSPPAARSGPAPTRRGGGTTAKSKRAPHGGSQSSPAVTFDSSE